MTEGAHWRATAAYYDSEDADTFYRMIWGGEDLHIGLYDDTTDIREASAATVDRMAAMLPGLGPETHVLDLGAGYGGSMRRLARRHGCRATCLNISETQNDINRTRTLRANLSDRLRVVHGAFETIPAPDARFDAVWSQDAFLHSDRRGRVIAEAFRVLKPGGHLIFTDPMQADDADPDVLRAVHDRLNLASLGSPGFYRRAGEDAGFDIVAWEPLSEHLATHYARVGEELAAQYDALRAAGASRAYLDRMLSGLENWVRAAKAGHLIWGIALMRKPDQA